MSKTHWLIGAALAILVAAPAMAQQPTDPSQADARALRAEALQLVPPNVMFRRVEGEQGFPGRNYSTGLAFIGDPLPLSKYWLGVECEPAPPALRSHLSLAAKQGLLVLLVSKGSPAAKAGLAQYDVLLRAGGKPLAEPRDLVAAVEAAKTAKMKIDLIRGGKPKTIEAAPAKRPEQLSGRPVQVPEQSDWNTIEKWLEGMAPGQQGEGLHGPFQFRVFGPGAIVPKGVWTAKPLPANMNINITKNGDEPAKITVNRGGEKWEVTEKDLGKLPADVRPYVEQMLGHGMFGIVGGAIVPNSATSGAASASGGAFQVPPPPPAMMQAQPFPGRLEQRLEKRFDEMNRRMDRLFKMMEKLGEGHAQQAAPEHHEKK